jgi:predicted N-acetyltransferase YhbS
VLVLGHSEYYPKFSFELASKWNIKPPIEVSDKAGLIEYLAEYY